jgi:hypothetical protein
MVSCAVLIALVFVLVRNLPNILMSMTTLDEMTVLGAR